MTVPLEQPPKDLPPIERKKLQPRKVFYSASIRDHLRALFADPDTASALGRAWEYAKERSNSLLGIDTDQQYEPVVPSSNTDFDETWTREQRRRAKETQRDIWDSLMWKKRILDSGFLSDEEPVNIVMALSSDEVNQFDVGGTSTYCFSRSPSPFPVFFLCVSLSVFLRVRPASKTS